MRPGQVRPGIHEVEPAPREAAPVASMRPGQVRPGIPGPRRAGAAGADRFNEAGAGSPRNTEYSKWSCLSRPLLQ